jgi:hypothetical protein
MSKGTWIPMRARVLVCENLSMSDIRRAPTTTPRLFATPPTITIVSTKKVREGMKSSGKIACE